MGTLGGGATGNWPPDDADKWPANGGPISRDRKGPARGGGRRRGGGPDGHAAGGSPDPDTPAPDTAGLPGAWGHIVVPDDPSELAAEAARVRAELRRSRQHTGRPWWLIGVPAQAGARVPSRLPALLLTLAIFTIVTGLIAVGYSGRQQPGPGGSTGTIVSGAGADDAGAGAGAQALPALDLLDQQGRAVSLRALLPAVVLLVDGCDCERFIAAAASATPPDVSVVVVSRHLPDGATPATDNVTRLADPAGELRSLLRLSPTAPSAAVVLVSGTAQVEVFLPQATSVEAIRDPLTTLSTD